jgi:glycosyltransferase involved in cell wall biosynthesis
MAIRTTAEWSTISGLEDKSIDPDSPRGTAAIVHDFFVTEGGADRCAIEFAKLLPNAPVYTSFFDAARFGDRIDPARVHTWPLQRLFGATRHFRSFLPAYVAYYSRLNVGTPDLVLSSSIAFTKAVPSRRPTLHVSYVYTPMRYAWDLDTYLEGSSYSPPARLVARTIRPLLRKWDVLTAQRPDVVVAISETVRLRIRRRWGREAELIYPPVATEEIPLSQTDEGFMLIAARLLAYRRVDLAVRACTSLGRRLIVVGEGPEKARLERLAGPSISFVGHVSRAELVDLFGRCSSYLVPGEEDFGIAPVEAMAAGKPVIALQAGGVAETVQEGVTGTFFAEPDERQLILAIQRADGMTFHARQLREHAEAYSTAAFHANWKRLLGRLERDPTSMAGR